MTVISQLNALSHLTPDEIANRLFNPFHTWVRGDIVTQELIDRFGELRIVICHQSYRERPLHNVEDRHKLSSSQGGFHYWELGDYQNGTLSARGSFWFRSKESYDEHPDEAF